MKTAGGPVKLLTSKLGFGSKIADSTKATGDGIGALNTGSSKAGSALSGLATGATIVGLTATTIAGISNAVSEANRTGEAEYENQVISDLKAQGSSYYKNKAWTSAVAAGEQASQHTGFSETFGNFGGGIATMWSNITGQSHIERNKQFFQWAKDSGAFGTGENATLNTLAYYYLLDEVNSLASVSGLTHKDLKQLVTDGSFKKWNMQSRITKLVNAGWHPEDSNHNAATGLNTIDRYLMAGLERVPRDNFHALLHKDEMVLNRRQANQYRKIFNNKNYGYGGSLNPSDSDYVGAHHSGYAGHNGIDLYFGDIGTPVGSAVPGKVIDSYDIPVNWNDGRSYHGKDTNGNAYSSYGRVVKVLGDDGHTYIYAHLNERKANTGDIVSAGTLLGYSGTTGNSSGPHLHFEVLGAGTGEANHAKYYTPYVRNVTGVASSKSSSTSSSSNVSAVSTLGSRRYISGAITGGAGGNTEGASRIVSSVDGGFNRLISYLDNISREQNEQRALLETYSISKSSPNFS